MYRKLLVASLVVVSFSISSTPAAACTFAKEPPKDLLKRSALVFRGKFLEANLDARVLVFQIDEGFKGSKKEKLVAVSNDAVCTATVEQQHDYVVYVLKDISGKLFIDTSSVKPVSEAAADLAFLRAKKK